MAKTKTSFNSDNQPKERKGRGKSERTKILEAMKRAGSTEEEFYDSLLTRSLDTEDNFGFKEMLNRMSPIPKAVAPLYEFTFDEKGTPYKKSCQVLKAMAAGKIPSDIGSLFINSIQSMLKIQEVTELERMIKELEERAKSGE
ncbi:MAG: hypothetical protein COA78_21035 [Blastopirellula sp.]|nr:MAG: hypothetical protein COA78_21035 [Blastopirellula sp.]